MISPVANYRPFFRSFRPIPPLGEFCQVSSETQTNMQAKRMAFCRVEMSIWSKLGQKRPEMEVRTFTRIKKVIWDQLLAAKAEIIQSKLYFRVACKNATK